MKTVLLIARDANLTELVQSSISDGFRLIVAAGEEEAAQAMGSEKPPVLLVDFYLGKRNGLDVLEGLTGRFGTFSRVVLLAPEKMGEGVAARATGQFVDQILRRPITSRMIRELLTSPDELKREERANLVEFLAESLRDSSAQRIDFIGPGVELSMFLKEEGVYGILNPNFGAVYDQMMKKA